MRFDSTTWLLRVFGTVDRPLELSWKQFLSLPMTEVVAEFHCVTGWSHLENTWFGVLGRTIYDLVHVRPETQHVILYSYSQYSSNTSLEIFLREDSMLAHKRNGVSLEPEHGKPVRAVISGVYGYKSVKWLTGIEFSTTDRPGLWEVRGYHNEANPLAEERFD